MNILIEPGLTLPPLSASDLEAIRAAAGPGASVVQTDALAQMLEAAPGIEVLFGNIYPELLAAAPKLQWVHATGSGVDAYLYPEFRDSDIRLTSEKGLVGPHLADHAMGLLLCLTRRIAHALRDAPRAWRHRVEYRREEVELEGLTLGVVGFGGTGRAIARRAAAFGMTIRAVDLYPESAEGVGAEPMEAFPALLAASDVIAIGLPLTPATKDLFDDERFALMKKGALLINVTRGEIVARDALLRALDAGRLAGAGLDVAWKEPLPEDDPLWRQPNVVMTPHTAGASQHRARRNTARFIENLGRYRRGEPLVGLIDKQAGF